MATQDRILLNDRAGRLFFWITYMPKVLGDGTFHLMGLRDVDEKMMDGKSKSINNAGATCSLRIIEK